MGQKLLLNLPDKDLEKIELLVNSGEYTTKTELIRFAVKQFLYSQERMKTLEELTEKLQKQVRTNNIRKGDIKKEVNEVKKETKKMIEKIRKCK
ncbi:MAG: hypothetical protein J4473_01580 [Candidatus Aenigmarchaeota archaeon]|nr:hypothetical protein [Candidatus Aenigmarchaeota archaeon]